MKRNEEVEKLKKNITEKFELLFKNSECTSILTNQYKGH